MMRMMMVMIMMVMMMMTRAPILLFGAGHCSFKAGTHIMIVWDNTGPAPRARPAYYSGLCRARYAPATA